MATTVRIDDKKLQEIIKKIGDVKPKKWIISDGVEYGVYQEFTDRGHPSLRPAFERGVKVLPEAIGQAVEVGLDINKVIGKIAFDIASEWAGDVNVDTGAYKNSIGVSEG